ncbi:PREDICTED: serologically defined colon cancer antigen 3 homolog [Apaloderma vittatum]|uniref:serologically defined colon cancer antigen 3 homolog n=1 Tax=Apaloderma vittatum TaxID=57397 RepID=UPI0005215F8C|nr:PREDICTED: serologically defined colon cancer antigen 3 homolog [Apaloderma vittatum]
MLAKHVLELEEEAQEFQEPAKDMEMPGGLSHDEEHNWTHHLPVHQKLDVLQTSRKAPCGSYDFFQSNVDKHMGVDAFAPWAHGSDPYQEYPENTREADPHMLHEEAIADRELPFLQPTYDMLREENSVLKRMVRSMQSSLKSQECTMRQWEMQLKASLVKEERKAQELESFAQWTECNLQLMTQWALEAESNVEKLKQEIFILRGELDRVRLENENLKADKKTDLGAVKHNMDFALQNLHKIINGANWSITQLTSGLESLHFLAEVLKSTGKISEVGAEKEL